MSTRLERTAILAAGVRLVAREGLEALSLRSVAASLGVTPMALYRHVRDSETLTDDVIETILATSARVTDTGDAGEALADWARRFHDDLGEYPGVAGWLLTHWFESGSVLDRIEEVLTVLDHHGVDGFRAVAVSNALFMYVLMRCEAEREVRSAGAVMRTLRTSAAGRPLPRLTALTEHYTTARFEAHFEYGLQALVAGMQVSAEATA